MDGLKDRLAALRPPVGHFLEWREDGLLITLIDPSIPAKVSRLVNRKQMGDVQVLNLVVLHAVNELRRKGSQVPLDADTVLIKHATETSPDSYV